MLWRLEPKERRPPSLSHSSPPRSSLYTSMQVHDIMKVEALLPKVDAKHGPYEGFKEGVVINDHDVALGYALGRVSDVAPHTHAQPHTSP